MVLKSGRVGIRGGAGSPGDLDSPKEQSVRAAITADTANYPHPRPRPNHPECLFYPSLFRSRLPGRGEQSHTQKTPEGPEDPISNPHPRGDKGSESTACFRPPSMYSVFSLGRGSWLHPTLLPEVLLLCVRVCVCVPGNVEWDFSGAVGRLETLGL